MTNLLSYNFFRHSSLIKTRYIGPSKSVRTAFFYTNILANSFQSVSNLLVGKRSIFASENRYSLCGLDFSSIISAIISQALEAMLDLGKGSGPLMHNFKIVK